MLRSYCHSTLNRAKTAGPTVDLRLPASRCNRFYCTNVRRGYEAGLRGERCGARWKNSVLLASALSATATALGGILVFAVMNRDKEEVRTNSQYASLTEMELVWGSRDIARQLGLMLTSTGYRRDTSCSRGRSGEYR